MIARTVAVTAVLLLVADAPHYTLWRDTPSSTTNLTANGNGNSAIDAGDLAVWRQNFGNASSTALNENVAVPEPATASLLLAALAVARGSVSMVDAKFSPIVARWRAREERT